MLQEAEGIAAEATPVEDQGKGCGAVPPADLLHPRGDGPGQRVVEGLGEEEQGSSPSVVQIDVGVPLDRQAALGVPAAGRGMLAVVRTEMPVHVIQSFPDRLQRQVTPKHLAREGHRIDTFGQGLDLGAQTQNGGSVSLADQHAQILAPAVLPVLEGAETQRKTENDRGYGLPPSVLPTGAGGGAETLENAPQVQASQGGVEQLGAPVQWSPRMPVLNARSHSCSCANCQ